MSEHEAETADNGHTFRISVAVRGSSKVVGDEHYRDGPLFDAVGTVVEVRAWNLPDALRKAADLPLSAWFEDEDEPSDRPTCHAHAYWLRSSCGWPDHPKFWSCSVCGIVRERVHTPPGRPTPGGES